MAEMDLYQPPPKNIFQRLVVFATIGLSILSLSPTWLTHIPIPRGNISFTGVIIIAGIAAYWISGYVPHVAAKLLRKALGISRDLIPQRQNITQAIIKKICAVIVFFYTLGYVLGISYYTSYLASLAIIVGIGWLLWWIAGETPYAISRMTSKNRLPIRAMIFFTGVVAACLFSIYFLINNPFYFLTPRYDFSIDGVGTMLRDKLPILERFLR